jgi:hypothetical protein
MPVQDAAQWPNAALQWSQEAGLQGNFFASPDFGSFVEWKLGDRAKAYTDTRGFFFSGTLLEDSLLTTQLCPDWQARLNRILNQGTDYFLIETDGARGRLWRKLQPNIASPLYLDQQVVILSSAQVRQALAGLSTEQPGALGDSAQTALDSPR